jgi:hypothetical protein
MNRKYRLIFLAILAVLFAIIAPTVIFFSLGWRLDSKNWRIIQPGLLYVKVYPKNCQVYMDGKLKKKTDFLFGSVLIDNLPAKKYEIEIKKDGFYSWKKTLEIKDGQPTEAKDIVLVPENSNFNALFKNIEDVFISPDEKSMILKEENPDFWSLKLYDPERRVKSALFDQRDFILKGNINQKTSTIETINIDFSKDSKTAVAELEIKDASNKEVIKKLYYIIDLNISPSLNYLEFLDQNTEKIKISPEDSSKLFILKNKVLELFDAYSEKPISSISGDIIDFSVFGSDIYYLDSRGIIYKTDFILNKRDKINNSPLSIKNDAKYSIEATSLDILIKENETIYYYNIKKDELIKIADNIKGYKISPDYKRLAYFNNYEIWVLFLGQEYNQPINKAGDKIFITRFSDEITSIYWYTYYYLIFNSGDKIKISEIDDRDSLNIIDLTSYKNPKIFWNQLEKKLYVLTEESLFVSDKLIP